MTREEYHRLYSGSAKLRPLNVKVPDNITIHRRDPSPCFKCGTRADLDCKHRKVEA